jgi:hypothetical protein
VKTRQIKEEEDYMMEIYNAKVEVAIARWKSGGYIRKGRTSKERDD